LIPLAPFIRGVTTTGFQFLIKEWGEDKLKREEIAY